MGFRPQRRDDQDSDRAMDHRASGQSGFGGAGWQSVSSDEVRIISLRRRPGQGVGARKIFPNPTTYMNGLLETGGGQGRTVVSVDMPPSDMSYRPVYELR